MASTALRVLVAAGLLAGTSGAAPPVGAAAWRTVHVGGMTAGIPAAWRALPATTAFGQTTWEYEGSDGSLQLSATPLAQSRNYFSLVPMYPFQPLSGARRRPDAPPYEAAAVSGNGTHVVVQLIDAAGTSLSLQIQVAAGDRALAQALWHRWRHPRPLSVTQAVRLMLRAENLRVPAENRVLPNFAEAFLPGRRDGWVLAGGPPATAQQAFFLFRTRDGGAHWSLLRYTTFAACARAVGWCVFPGEAGPVAMVFWSPREGVMAQAGFASNTVGVFVTADGGRLWRSQVLRTAGNPLTVSLVRRHGRLVLRAPLIGHPPFVAVSRDGGLRWTAAASTP